MNTLLPFLGRQTSDNLVTCVHGRHRPTGLFVAVVKWIHIVGPPGVLCIVG